MSSIAAVLFLVLFQTYVSSLNLNMAGGRSPAEKLVSKKNMFKDLRTKFNTAAEIPGFFEVGDGPAEIELYCKSNKDGNQIGDCPFAQFIQVSILSIYILMIRMR